MPNKKKKDKVIEAVICEEETKTNDSKQEIKIMENTTNNTKPYFFPRLVAYIIDIILVSIVCSGIMFLIPENKNYDKYMKEYEQIQTDFIEEKITMDEYLNKSVDVVYDIDYTNVLSMITEVVLIILYFVVFQFYNKGQTFGKKVMKLRVVSMRNEGLTLNQVAYRALIMNSVFINILVIGSLLFLGKNYYFYASLVLQLVASVIIFVTLMMILFRKDGRGLHDVMAGTKVIQEN